MWPINSRQRRGTSSDFWRSGGSGDVRFRIGWLACACLLFSVSVAEGSDGVLEINQACAVNTGCFDGDTAGFPVSITEGGSYRLTGNLTLLGEGSPTSMISIFAHDVTLDLNGFAIRCAGGGGGNCSGTTDGIAGSRSNITVKNGIVTDMPGDGVVIAGSGLRGVDLQAMNNGGDGLSFGTGSGFFGEGLHGGVLVERSVASGNGGDGILVGRESLIRGCVSRGNGGKGLSGTATPTGEIFVSLLMSGYVENVVQNNDGAAVTGLRDMGSNLCLDCP